MPPRILLPSDDQLPADIRDTLANLPPVNVFRMMANAPPGERRRTAALTRLGALPLPAANEPPLRPANCGTA